MDSNQPLTFASAVIENSRTVIGNYILGTILGEGTFGVVKQSTHIITGAKVRA
jgi:hypothetical protein